jgi:hypothetical protein
MDGRDGTCEDTQDTTRIVEIAEVKRVIRVMLFVTKLSPVDAHKDKETGWGATLKCASCHGVKQTSRISCQLLNLELASLNDHRRPCGAANFFFLITSRDHFS